MTDIRALPRLPHTFSCVDCGQEQTRDYFTYPSGKPATKKATRCTKCQRKRDYRWVRRPRKIFWTEDRKTLAAQFWEEEKTGREIAAHFGVTHNAIMGLLSRLGLLGKRRPKLTEAQRQQRRLFKKRQYNRTYRAKRKPVARFNSTLASARSVTRGESARTHPTPLNLSFIENQGCMMEVDHRIYCGHDKAPGSSYCAFHAEICGGRRVA